MPGLVQRNILSYLLLVRTRNGVISKVGTVDLAADGNLSLILEILKSEDRTGSVGEEGVTGICTMSCAHVRKNADVIYLIERFIVSDTV